MPLIISLILIPHDKKSESVSIVLMETFVANMIMNIVPQPDAALSSAGSA